MVKQASGIAEPADIDLDALSRESAVIWSTKNVRLPKDAQWDFQDRAWQVQIFDDAPPNLVVIKPTQIGLTTLMLCKMFHQAHYHPLRAMYTLPRQDDVYDLVNGRVTSMLENSPALAAKLSNVDNVRLKVYGSSYIHFMESTVPPRMLDVDLLINDEVDLSNQDYLEQYIARLDASLRPLHWRISTPTIHNFGIHAAYERSTKNTWLVKCPRCGLDQELQWDANMRHKGGDTWLSCTQCDKRLEPEVIQDGRWVSEYPGRDIVGYSVSQLMVTSISPQKLYNDSLTMTAKNFYNLRLGKPYTPATGGISRSAVYEKCFPGTVKHLSTGEGYFLGADQGNDIHVLIGKPDGDLIRIVHAEVIPIDDGFDRLEYLMKAYGIRQAVVDGLPNRHSALAFARKFTSYRAACAFYSSVQDMYKTNPGEFSVLINRSMMFDSLYEKLNEGKIIMYGSRSAMTDVMRKFVNHVTSIKRDEVHTETKLGGKKTEITWVSTADDHFAHALLYLATAIDMKSSHGGFRAVEVTGTSGHDVGIEVDRKYNIYAAQGANLREVRRNAVLSSRGIAR